MDIVWNQPLRPALLRALQQDPAYGAACRALGSRVLTAEIRDGSATIAMAQLVHRNVLGIHAAVCTRGPVWQNAPGPEQRAAALRLLCRTVSLPWTRAVFVTPEAGGEEVPTLAAARMARVMTAYSTATLDLTRSPAELRADMHQKWRNRLVAAEGAGLRIARADRTPRHYIWLIRAEAEQQRARRYAALPPQLAREWQRAGGKLRVLTASHGGEPVAAMLFLIHGTSATYHIGWSNAEGKRLSANNLLLWTAMRKLARAGVRELDLGGLNTQDIPGIARFKLGTGARVKTLCGTWFGR